MNQDQSARDPLNPLLALAMNPELDREIDAEHILLSQEERTARDDAARRADEAWRAQLQAEREAEEAEEEAEEEKAAAEREARLAEREKAEQAERDEAEALAREMLEDARILIHLDGNIYPVSWDIYPDGLVGRYPDDKAVRLLRDLVKKGRLCTLDDKPITGDNLKRLKAILLRTYADYPSPGKAPSQDRDFLIPGLWQVGTIPSLSGPYKVGKTMVTTVEVVPSITVPGHRFMNCLDALDNPSVIAEIERRGVCLINAESPVADVEEGLWPVDEADRRHLLTVEHLEHLGGAQVLDLTDPKVYEFWWHRLSTCEVCDSTDFITPYVVIVDGLTEILIAAGKDIEQDSAKWFVEFKRLLKSLGIPNGLVVGHSTMKGGHAMGGTDFLGLPDGLWRYSSTDPDDPFSNRWFTVSPRGIGGVPIPQSQVTRGADGRFTLHRTRRRGGRRSTPSAASGETSEGAEPTASPEPAESITELVLAYVRGCNAHSDGPTLTQVRENVAARNVEVDAALAELAEAGKLEIRPRPKRGGGKSYWVVGS